MSTAVTPLTASSRTATQRLVNGANGGRVLGLVRNRGPTRKGGVQALAVVHHKNVGVLVPTIDAHLKFHGAHDALQRRPQPLGFGAADGGAGMAGDAGFHPRFNFADDFQRGSAGVEIAMGK